MFFASIRRGAAVAGLCLSAAAAPAATVTDASFMLEGTYAYDWGRYGFGGTFEGQVFGDPTLARDYDLGISLSFSGTPVLDRSVPIASLVGSPFSIYDAAEGAVSAPGFGVLFGALSSITDDIVRDATSVAGDFSFRLDYGTSFLLKMASCFSLFSSGCAHSGDYALAFDLSYEAPDLPPSPAAVPLPAALPLLGAGLAALALFRRRRA